MTVAGSYSASAASTGTMHSSPLSKQLCASGDIHSTLRIESVEHGADPSAMVFSSAVADRPLNRATNAQKCAAFSPLTENGMMWQLAPRQRPVTTQVLLSRDAQAVLTSVRRERVMEEVVVLGPGCAMKARRPESVVVASERMCEARVSGEESVCRRSRVPRVCAVPRADSRRLFCAGVRVESVTSSSRRVMAASYSAVGGAAAGEARSGWSPGKSSTVTGKKKEAGVTGKTNGGANWAGAERRVLGAAEGGLGVRFRWERRETSVLARAEPGGRGGLELADDIGFAGGGCGYVIVMMLMMSGVDA